MWEMYRTTSVSEWPGQRDPHPRPLAYARGSVPGSAQRAPVLPVTVGTRDGDDGLRPSSFALRHSSALLHRASSIPPRNASDVVIKVELVRMRAEGHRVRTSSTFITRSRCRS